MWKHWNRVWILYSKMDCYRYQILKALFWIFWWRNMKIVDIFCDRRESVILLYWQGMQKSLCAGFFEIRNNSRIILGSPWRRDQCFHPKHTGSKNPGNIIIWDNNTAIFIILLENVQKLSQSHLWFDTGLTLTTTATMLIYPNYLKNLIM